ncbi:YpmP family protein [Bacillus pumilus]|uniref:YpmP family protein n=1 Tax=Bacillus TaxID=1386 RepID=UPI0011A8DE4E|nr:YpmP family protein [Bacillus pumilus]MBQ4818032.1 YpmP family protein [Bacillus pumilus]WIG30315.1 YpmP family protein [Bacillus pumilus]
MLLKTICFRRMDGAQIKVTEVPVLKGDEPHGFMLTFRLEAFLKKVYVSKGKRTVYSFREDVKRNVKWSTYEQIYQEPTLKHNA